MRPVTDLMLRALLATILLTCVGKTSALTAHTRSAPVYFLAIGSSRYLDPSAPDDHGFASLAGARNSAIALADSLTQGGARFGITLTSPEGTIVGKPDIDNAVDAILARIARDRKSGEAPILIVYLTAHGISEGFAWNQFVVPGDFTYRGPPEALPIEPLVGASIHAATLVDRLNKAKLHYLLLIDTCYEGTASRFDSPILSATAQQNIGDIAAGLRFLNEFRQANPVVFSTAPGTKVPTAPDPDDPKNSMGPLARRLLLHIRANGDRPVTTASLLAALLDPEGDGETGPAISYAKSASWWSLPLIRVGTVAGEVEDREGTASSPRLCCQSEAQAPSPNRAEIPARGTIALRSEAGESLLEGHMLTLTANLTVTRPDARTLSIDATDPDGDWSFNFQSAEDLAVGLHDGATRYPFQDDDRNGLSATGRGTACNELRGAFQVTALPANDRGPLALRFTQYCDGDKAALHGDISLELKGR